jgi:acyl dehydratase
VSTVHPEIEVAGPWYDDLEVGQVFDSSPGLTIGDRLRLALDVPICQAVVGAECLVAHPGLVCDVSIGQSTTATQRVIANLFYRRLAFRRFPVIGDTLRTRTEVVALRDCAPRPGRCRAGLVALRVTTTDQLKRPVLDYYRCAMLPTRPGATSPHHADDLAAIEPDAGEDLRGPVAGWDLAAFRELIPGAHAEAMIPGTRFVAAYGDTVSGAPELARLTLNVAAAHSDPGSTPYRRRLVYGGHTIGMALAHATRALPNLVTIVAWRHCNHIKPVFEGDLLRSAVTVESIDSVAHGAGALVDLRIQTTAKRACGGCSEPVLDWRLVAVMA